MNKCYYSWLGSKARCEEIVNYYYVDKLTANLVQLCNYCNIYYSYLYNDSTNVKKISKEEYLNYQILK